MGVKGTGAPPVTNIQTQTLCSSFPSAKEVSFAHLLNKYLLSGCCVINTLRMCEQCAKPTELPALLKVILS